MKALKVFFENREPVKLTLQTIGRLEKVCGQSSQVYVVENPAVFSVLIWEYPQRTVICGMGNYVWRYLFLWINFRATLFGMRGILIRRGFFDRTEIKGPIWRAAETLEV